MTHSNVDRISQHWHQLTIGYSDELTENSSKPNARLSARTGREIGYTSQHSTIYVILDFSDWWRKKTSVSQQIYTFLSDLSSYCRSWNFEVIYVWGGNEISQSNNLDQARNNRTLMFSDSDRNRLYDWGVNESDYQIILISDCQLDYNYSSTEHQLTVWQLAVPRGYQWACFEHHTQIPLHRPFMTFL